MKPVVMCFKNTKLYVCKGVFFLHWRHSVTYLDVTLKGLISSQKLEEDCIIIFAGYLINYFFSGKSFDD